MAWTPVLLSLLAYCPCHWILGVWGRSPSGTQGSVLYHGAQAVLWDSAPPSQCLSFLSAGSWAQSGLTQEASVSRSLGPSVTLTCTGSSNHVGFYGAGWFQHRPGAVPRTVMWGSSRSSGLRARLSGSRSGSTASLSISGLQAEDEADNYCSTWAHSLSAPAVPRDVGKSDKNLSLPDGSLWLTGVQQQWEDWVLCYFFLPTLEGLELGSQHIPFWDLSEGRFHAGLMSTLCQLHASPENHEVRDCSPGSHPLHLGIIGIHLTTV